MSTTDKRWMIGLILLCCIVASNGIVYASDHLVEDREIELSHALLSVTETGKAIQTASEKSIQGDTVAYSGSESAFSVFYHPVLLAGTLLGVAILFVIGYYLIRKWRVKGNK
ncbi:hypothetical protein RJ53_11100 [Methanocalculus chunghsingensis]|uniref:Uncharacterized protein n=2 Tax=Methanocalculus chunghsingensis TaxID=156457 RepID=A0A8J7W7M4_9EURY|nr:hypothetical protein [Methanocalculus chunghsingensis]